VLLAANFGHDIGQAEKGLGAVTLVRHTALRACSKENPAKAGFSGSIF